MLKVPKVERRRLRRIVKRIPAAFESGELRGQGYIKNVSKEGLFVRTSTLPAVGSEVRLLFHDLAGSKVEVRGTVCWTTEQLPSAEKAKPGFGVFIARGPEDFVAFFRQIVLG